MPKKLGRKPDPQKPNISSITCQMCGETKKPVEYYASSSVYHLGTGRVQFCKNCCIDMSHDENGIINVEKFKILLEQIDKPFLNDVLQSAYEESQKDGKSTPFQLYFKNINSLNQYKKMTWKDSKFNTDNNINHNQIKYETHFNVTNEMILKWGSKYDPEDYYELEQFYNDMQRTNNIETTQDMIYLKKLAIISLKMDKELEDGNYDEAKKLGDLFSKYMADSKFRAMDKTDADKTGGIRNFSSIYAEVEKDGFIPPWEYYRKIKGISQDIVDKTIMHIENFTLKLNKIEKMISPPLDTPKLENDEIDTENTIQINDIEVDLDLDSVKPEVESDEE
jgi:hypothetical protein